MLHEYQILNLSFIISKCNLKNISFHLNAAIVGKSL